MIKTFDIVIPAFNEAAELPRTLDACHQAIAAMAQTQGGVIVVDNNSSDNTTDIARTHGARVVHEPFNQIGRARNTGVAASQADALIFLDADTQISEQLLTQTLTALNQDGCIGGGARLVMDPKPDWFTGRILWLWNTYSRLSGSPAGCYFFCLREDFHTVGGFDERFFASEEIWLGKALKKLGKPQRQKLIILNETVTTSGRKCENPWHAWKWVIFLLLCPFAVRFRGLCGFWYARPN